MPHLEFTQDGRTLFQHRLQPGRTVVGRSDRCDVALPSEAISRTHCTIDRRTEGWWLQDRSRHGTFVNDEPVTRHLLADGDEIRLGPYLAHFSLRDAESDETTTNMAPLTAAVHEELVEVDDTGMIAASQALLRFVRGPHDGRQVRLERTPTTVGGHGSDLVLDDVLPAAAVRIRVVRGRVMVQPGAAASYLAGVRVRTITPALPGEEIRVGDHGMVVDVRTVEETPESTHFGESVGASPAMRRLFGVLRRMAAHDAPVLLTGESGTGKELTARAMHDNGPRHGGPFVAINCAAIAEQLFESELFGHEKGSFTGATARAEGAFQRADGGTLFLDEIGELRLDAQAKLLRALESGEVRRVGGGAPEFPDVRIVAATNRNLQQEVRSGTFRNDLYFRLAVLTVRLPALRERREDIGLLARTLLQRNHPGATLTDDALQALEGYEWPGNIREMRNVLTRAFVLSGHVIDASALSFNPWAFDDAPPTPLTPAPRNKLGDAAATAEIEAITDALRRAEGNRTRAARDLGIPRSSLLYKLRKHGLG